VNQAVQEALVFTRPGAAAEIGRDYPRRGIVRRSEWVILGFLVYAVALVAVLPVAPSVRHQVMLLNAAILAGYTLLVLRDPSKVDGTKPALAFSVTRDAVSLGLIVLAYREMGWLAQPRLDHSLEASWVAWDRAVLRGGATAVMESLGPVIPSILEISYALVYALAPFAIAMLYICRRGEKVDQFLLVFAVAVLLCYAQFPFWPSEPPRVIFLGQDLPSYETVFRRFNLWMLGNYGIHTSVFPSAHVAGAFGAAFGAITVMPERRWVSRLLLVIASLIAIATVYGRYHYVLDAVAGLLMALVAFTALPAESPESQAKAKQRSRPRLGYARDGTVGEGHYGLTRNVARNSEYDGAVGGRVEADQPVARKC
jgi:membrane-associated phospholipid phosphatase